jgi:hypothetical protein
VLLSEHGLQLMQKIGGALRVGGSVKDCALIPAGDKAAELSKTDRYALLREFSSALRRSGKGYQEKANRPADIETHINQEVR